MTRQILLVDDEADPDGKEVVLGNYLTYYQELLWDEGYQVVVAQSENEAREHLTRHEYPLVILDLHFTQSGIPRASNPTPLSAHDLAGVELAKWIEKRENRPMVVVLTNVNDPDVNNKLNDLTCVEHILHKHLCTPRELVKVVTELLEKTE